MPGFRYTVVVVILSQFLYFGASTRHPSTYGSSLGAEWKKKSFDEFNVITKKTFDDHLPVRALWQLKNATQSMRRSLKIMRKWCHSHPSEIILGKCLANYFNIKIPGLRRSEITFPDYNDQEETMEENEYSSYGTQNKEWRDIKKDLSEFSFENLERTLDEKFHFWKHCQNIASALIHYADFIINHPLVICFWNYAVKKFWTWVDEAPLR